ncbi:MAG: F0F1 ATP synthase subunit B [Acidobacteriota bacterium]|nr:F0F1 ATP synthase subunit B [Acidobacteriota bacterium]
MIRIRFCRLSALLIAGWTTLPLLAASEGESDTFLGLPRTIFLWANLILFFGILYKFIGPPIKGFLASRGKQIASSLTNAEDQRRDAEQMKASLENQISELKTEMDQLLERARAEGEREREQILAQAERERERLLAQTQEEIRVRTAQAKSELTTYTASLAADLARKQIEQTMRPDDAKRLFDENLDRLEKVAR